MWNRYTLFVPQELTDALSPLLEKWEKESESLLLGDQKKLLITEAKESADVIDLDNPIPQRELIEAKRSEEGYKRLFRDS